MENVNGLRIGNIVYNSKYNSEGLVTSVDTEGIDFLFKDGHYYCKKDEISPIKTSLKLLQEFGFQETNDKNKLYIVANANFNINANRNGVDEWTMTIEDREGKELDLLIPIDNIHTFQNAYYVLFTEEIDVI